MAVLRPWVPLAWKVELPDKGDDFDSELRLLLVETWYDAGGKTLHKDRCI